MVALVVVAQGLTAQEALAQIQSCGSGGPVPVATGPATTKTVTFPPTHTGAAPDSSAHFILGMIEEKMSSFRDGGSHEVVRYIQQRII